MELLERENFLALLSDYADDARGGDSRVVLIAGEAGFHRNDTLGIWALHAWIWRPNPGGMHADFNPQVSLC